MKLTTAQIEVIERVRMRIEQNVLVRITISDLLTEPDISKYTLQRWFKTRYGTTLCHYHLIISMEYAEELLADGMLVKQAAIKFGYSSIDSFSRAFKKVFPHPPGSHRLQ